MIQRTGAFTGKFDFNKQPLYEGDVVALVDLFDILGTRVGVIFFSEEDDEYLIQIDIRTLEKIPEPHTHDRAYRFGSLYDIKRSSEMLQKVNQLSLFPK